MPELYQFDKGKYKKLKESWKKAVEEKKDSFNFENQELVTDYAKYLIQYLKSKFDEKTD